MTPNTHFRMITRASPFSRPHDIHRQEARHILRLSTTLLLQLLPRKMLRAHCRIVRPSLCPPPPRNDSIPPSSNFFGGFRPPHAVIPAGIACFARPCSTVQLFPSFRFIRHVGLCWPSRRTHLAFDAPWGRKDDGGARRSKRGQNRLWRRILAVLEPLSRPGKACRFTLHTFGVRIRVCVVHAGVWHPDVRLGVTAIGEEYSAVWSVARHHLLRLRGRG